jgi:hypothetical protein
MVVRPLILQGRSRATNLMMQICPLLGRRWAINLMVVRLLILQGRMA